MMQIWSNKKRVLSREHVASLIEDFANNPNVPLVILANKYQIAEQTVGKYITEVMFGGPVKKDPVIIVLQSKINDDINQLI